MSDSKTNMILKKLSKSFMRFLKHYFKSFLMSCVIVYLSFATASDFEGFKKFHLFEGVDKVVHYFFYLVLAFFLLLESKSLQVQKLFQKDIFFAALIYPVIFGGIIEVSQGLFTSTRTAELADWLF